MRHSRRNRKSMSEINVVPYIDVMLVLLVIFMVTAPLLTEGVKVDLPRASAKAVKDTESLPFILHVDKEGRYYLNDGEGAVDSNEIRVKATAVYRHNPETSFLVRGDRTVSYQHIINAMVLIQQAGVPSVGLVTKPSPVQ